MQAALEHYSDGCGGYDPTELDRFITKVRAEAWDEGAAYVNAPFGIEPGMRNPYRKDDE